LVVELEEDHDGQVRAYLWGAEGKERWSRHSQCSRASLSARPQQACHSLTRNHFKHVYCGAGGLARMDSPYTPAGRREKAIVV
jgi:hypothetical protein